MTEQNQTDSEQDTTGTDEAGNTLTPPGDNTQPENPPTPPEPKGPVLARILLPDTIDGCDYQPNQLVQFPATKARQLQKAGKVDTSKSAVAYCKEQGAEVIVHGQPKAATKKKAKAK